MKKGLYFILAAVLLFSLASCGAKPEIAGIWEQEMETAILREGIAEPISAGSLCRFTFREDGTGLQEHIIQDGSYPVALREFTWLLEGDTLILDHGGGNREEFAILLGKTSLKLENQRGSYDLIKSE